MHDIRTKRSRLNPLPPDRLLAIRKILTRPLLSRASVEDDVCALLEDPPSPLPNPLGEAQTCPPLLPSPLCPFAPQGKCACHNPTHTPQTDPSGSIQEGPPHDNEPARSSSLAHSISSSPLEVLPNSSHLFQAWIIRAKDIRKRANQEVSKEVRRLNKLHRSEWAKTFAREQHKNSKRFQAMALGRPLTQRPSALRDPSQNVVHFSPDGLASTHKKHYAAMGRPRMAAPFANPAKPWLAPNIYAQVASKIRNLGPQASLCQPINMEALHTLIRSLANTAGGTDGVQNDILKSLLWPPPPLPPDTPSTPSTNTNDTLLLDQAQKGRQLLLRLILGLINTVLESNSVPEALLRGEIVSIYKGAGDPTLLSSYRPITLLSGLYKLITALLNQRITTISNKVGGILSDAQCGSRPGQSSDAAATVLHHIFKHAERNDNPIHVLSTDISKAYDAAPYQGFLDAFEALGFDAQSIALIDALQSRFSCVARTFAGLTDTIPIDTGCKQGCALSPLRFNVFLDMFIRYVNSLDLGYPVQIAHLPRGTSLDDAQYIRESLQRPSGLGPESTPRIIIGVVGYFDDLTLIADSNSTLQTMARHLEVFLGTYGMSLNANKCHYTCWEPPPASVSPSPPPPPLDLTEQCRRHPSTGPPHPGPSSLPLPWLLLPPPPPQALGDVGQAVRGPQRRIA